MHHAIEIGVQARFEKVGTSGRILQPQPNTEGMVTEQCRVCDAYGVKSTMRCDECNQPTRSQHSTILPQVKGLVTISLPKFTEMH